MKIHSKITYSLFFTSFLLILSAQQGFAQTHDKPLTTK